MIFSKFVDYYQLFAMPRKRQPLTLENLALEAFGECLKIIGRKMVATIKRPDAPQGHLILQLSLDYLNELIFQSIPWYLYDRMAVQVLKSTSELIKEIKETFVPSGPISTFINQMNIVVNLTEVAIHPCLTSIDISQWPKIMRHVLYKTLPRMTGMEILNLGSGSGGWKTSDIEKSIISGVLNMKNLTQLCLCFDCTDHILNKVGDTCKNLQSLDVTSSRSVTDRSVSALTRCKRLKELHLYRTSISTEGFAILLSNLPQLEDLGRHDEFGSILEHIRTTCLTIGPFPLRNFQSKDMTTVDLNLLIEMCPYISNVFFYHDIPATDLTVFAALENLTDLKLLNCDFFTDRVNLLLEMRGRNLVALHLEHVDQIDMNALIYISQYCPNLKKLVLYNCEFLEHTSISLRHLTVLPFQNLEHLMCVADCALTHLEFLLSNCFNIKFIQLGSSTGIGDETMFKVFEKNSMKHLEVLRILYSDNLSMNCVRLLMEHCENLKVLSELESWQGISYDQLREFRREIKDYNFDLDVSPTLSY